MNEKIARQRRIYIPWLLASALLLSSAQTHASLALAQKSGCTACHAMGSKVMGPAFLDIAGKYAGHNEAVNTLVQNIRDGGSGRWGTLPMPPQPQLNATTVKALATWIAAGAR